MARSSLSPRGFRLGRNYRGLIKGLELLPPQAGYWADIWNTYWGNGSVLQSQVAQVAAVGANATKICMFPSTEVENGHTFPAENVYRPRRQQFFQWCRNNGLRLQVEISNNPAQVFGANGTSGPANIPGIAAIAATIEQDASDIMTSIEVIGEFNNGGVSTWNAANTSVNAQQASDMSALFDAVRAATTLPLTASVSVSSPSALMTNTYLDLQYTLGLDCHDVHLYYQDRTYSAAGLFPQSSDMVNLETRSKYLGSYVIGEMGCALTAGTTLQTRWFNGIGDIIKRPDCKGAFMFGLTDFDTTYRYGMYQDTDTSFSAPRLGMLTPFQGWAAL